MFILSVMDVKIEQCVCIKFFMKLGKSTNKTFKMLCEATGEYSLCRTAGSLVPVEDDKSSG
jgi:hypothetical protein